jgi:hypothetical protein
MDWTFGNIIWAMLGGFFWFAIVWVCVMVLSDVFRREVSGWAKAGWVLLVVVLPLIGTMIYLISGPSGAGQAGLSSSAPHQRRRDHEAANEIDEAAQLLDRGRITPDEYEHLKGHALAARM